MDPAMRAAATLTEKSPLAGLFAGVGAASSDRLREAVTPAGKPAQQLRSLMAAAPPSGTISGDMLSKYIVDPRMRAKLEETYGDATKWTKDRISAIIANIEGTQ